MPDWPELRRLGLYDPDEPDAAEVRALLEYLVGEGVTPGELRDAADAGRLTSAAGDLRVRPGRPVFTLGEAAEQVGTTPTVVAQLWRAAGLVAPDPTRAAFSEADVGAVSVLVAARGQLGAEPLVQLVRVFGSSLARMADAAVRTVLANVEGTYGPQVTDRVEHARTGATTALMAEASGPVLEVLFRHHLAASARLTDVLTGPGPEAVTAAIGFVDLVGSTGLALDLSPGALAQAMSDLDALSSEATAERGGRVVKLIGDAVMFVAADAVHAIEIALDLVATLAAHPILPEARGAVATGLVTTRDGDYFGPVVNLAARLVHLAEPGQVIAPVEVAELLDRSRFRAVERGTHDLRGYADPVAVRSVSRAAPRSP